MSGGSCDTDCEVPVFEDPDLVVVLGGSLGDLQRAGERLAENGIEAAIASPDTDGAGGGCCSPKLYLVVAREDAQRAFSVFDAEWRRGLSDEQIAALEAASAIVLDPDAAETTCPACLTTFETGPSSCPDCGLTVG